MGYFWLAVAVISSGGYGYLKGKRAERAYHEGEATKEPEPVCGCKHHFSLHNDDGTCGAKWTKQVLVERGQPQNVKDGPNGYYVKTVYDHERWETVNYSCTCQRYTGPEPLPRFVS